MFHQTNKFDQQQGYHFMMQQQMMQQEMMQNMPQNYMERYNNYQQQVQYEQQQPKQGDIEKIVLDTLSYYFSEENLNKDAFFRSKMNSDGYVDVVTILSFNRMNSTGVTPDKLAEVLKNNKTNIEFFTDKESNILYLRNKDWDLIKDKLIPIETLQQQKKNRKINPNINYVNMQNNYYVQNPQHMNQQMDMNMLNQYMMNPQYQQQMYNYQQQMMHQNQMMDPSYQMMQQQQVQMQQQQPHDEQ